jgi:hypothetical protein
MVSRPHGGRVTAKRDQGHIPEDPSLYLQYYLQYLDNCYIDDLHQQVSILWLSKGGGKDADKIYT